MTATPPKERLRRQHRYTVTPEHLTLDPRLSDRAHRLWCRLDRFIGAKEIAFPARWTLAVELDTSRSSVDRALSELESAGWIVRESQPGGTTIYTLTVAPEKATMRLIEAERKKRWEAARPQIEKEASKRREYKKAQAKKAGHVTGDAPAADPGVVTGDAPVTSRGGSTGDAPPSSAGHTTGDAPPAGPGVVIGDAPLGKGGLVTGDETGLVTGDAPGRVTGDALKEAPPTGGEGSNKEGDSAPPLRYGAAATSDDAEPEDDVPPTDLMVVDETPPGHDVEVPEQFHGQFAAAIVTDYLSWYRLETGSDRIPEEARVVMGLKQSYVRPALEAKYTRNEVAKALATAARRRGSSVMPSKSTWRDCLLQAGGGRDITTATGWGAPRQDPARVTAQADTARAVADTVSAFGGQA